MNLLCFSVGEFQYFRWFLAISFEVFKRKKIEYFFSRGSIPWHLPLFSFDFSFRRGGVQDFWWPTAVHSIHDQPCRYSSFSGRSNPYIIRAKLKNGKYPISAGLIVNRVSCRFLSSGVIPWFRAPLKDATPELRIRKSTLALRWHHWKVDSFPNVKKHPQS